MMKHFSLSLFLAAAELASLAPAASVGAAVTTAAASGSAALFAAGATSAAAARALAAADASFFSTGQRELRARNAAAGVPVPSAAQAGALNHTFVVFEHFSVCTYTGCQWNTAVSPATAFAPPDSGPNISQWMDAVKAMGASQICLTVRHVGGFTLWPSATTNYSVAAASWRGGEGDIVADFVAAARAAGVSPCLYVILGFDIDANHTGVPGPVYLDRQVDVLTELLTRYGQIDRLWWDNYAIGCCQPVTHEFLYCPGGGTTSTPSPACPGWQVLIDTVHALSPLTSVVPGPHGCLVNGESFGGTYPLYHATTLAQNSYSCTDASRVPTSASSYFAVVESDFTLLEPGDNWFQSPADPFLNASQIYDQVTAKLDQGANLIFNVPADASGVIPSAYVEQVALFGAARSATYSQPIASLAAPAVAPCADLSVELPVSGAFDTVLLAEDLLGGQVIASYTLEVRDAASGAWRALTAGVHGKTVGLRLADFVGAQTGVAALRFNCTADLAPPPPPPPATFTNAGGQCLGQPDGAAFPCSVGPAVPGGQVFHTCPLVASSCSGPAAVWTAGPEGNTLFALGAGPDATINVDCDACAAGTHAKLISDADCGCSAALAYDGATKQLAVSACPGMCLTTGVSPGALPSCAGNETVIPTQVHLQPCTSADTVGWTRSAAAGPSSAATATAPPPVATLKTFGAYVNVRPA